MPFTLSHENCRSAFHLSQHSTSYKHHIKQTNMNFTYLRISGKWSVKRESCTTSPLSSYLHGTNATAYRKLLTSVCASKLRQLCTSNWIATSPNASLEERSCLLWWWQTAELIVHHFWNCLLNFRNQLLSADFSKLSVVTRNATPPLA